MAPAAEHSRDSVWIDLTTLNRAACTAVQERYGLPPEVTTYFLLRYQSAKLIHAGPALFLVTFLAVPSVRHLFTARELKICVTPTLVATLCGVPGKSHGTLAQMLPLLSGLGRESVGRFLGGLLEGVIGSYEVIVKAVENGMRREEQQWGRRVEKFIQFLREERVFLSNVTRNGSKLFAAEESDFLRHLEERVGVLARVTWDATRPKKDERVTLASVLSEKGDGDA
jgi:Mg2+ and Co2+ transporter CorA